MTTAASIRFLVGEYDNGGVDFSTLLEGLVARWRDRPEKRVEPADWAEVHRRAEEIPDDDELFWISVAEDRGTLTIEQAEQIFTAIESAAVDL